MLSLANNCAEALGYAVTPALGEPDQAVMEGGPSLAVVTQRAGSLTSYPERVEVRSPRFDVRYVLRDFNGMGSTSDFGMGLHGRIEREASPHTDQSSPWGVNPTLARGQLGRWDEGTGVLPGGLDSTGGI